MWGRFIIAKKVRLCLKEVFGLNWLYFDLNSYFATIEQQVNHSLRGKPIAVVPLLSDSTCAIAASYEAKLKGIKTGTKIYEAKKLCPELICVPVRHKLYVEYHTRIFAEVNKLLYIDYICSIDEGAGRLTGKYQQEEEAIRLAQVIKLAIKQNVGDYITCSIGIAPSKYLAKIAAEMKKPDGLSIIKPEDIPTKLFGLSLRDIPGIGHSRILAPEIRKVNAARDVAVELIMKAAKRLRDKALYSTFINLYIRTTNRVVYKSSAKISPACDNATILKQLLIIWDRLAEQNKVNNVHQVAVSLAGLIEKPR